MLRPIPGFLLLALGSASCSAGTGEQLAASASSAPASPPAFSSLSAPSSAPSSASTSPPSAGPADTAEDRRRAAILWLRYAERTLSARAPERASELALHCAYLGYPLDAAYGKAALARAEALLKKSSTPEQISTLTDERVRQGQPVPRGYLEELKRLAAAEKANRDRAEGLFGRLGAFHLLAGDAAAAHEVTLQHPKSEMRENAHDRMLSTIVGLGRSDLALPLIDDLAVQHRKRWLLAVLAEQLASVNERSKLLEVARRFDAVPIETAVPGRSGSPEQQPPWWHAMQLIADARLIDALTRAGETAEARKRIGDATRYWVEWAPRSLSPPDVAAMLARDRGRVGQPLSPGGKPAFFPCDAAPRFARFDAKLGLELLALGRKLDPAAQCVGDGNLVNTLAVADQRALIEFWDTVEWSSGPRGLHATGLGALIDAVTWPGASLDGEALREVEARLDRQPQERR